METTYISMQDSCLSYKIDKQFLHILAEHELIEIVLHQQEECIHEDSLTAIERFTTLYYDLDLNLQGIEVANHLLQTIDRLQIELQTLKNRTYLSP